MGTLPIAGYKGARGKVAIKLVCMEMIESSTPVLGPRSLMPMDEMLYR